MLEAYDVVYIQAISGQYPLVIKQSYGQLPIE
jgi:hypothetical protein